MRSGCSGGPSARRCPQDAPTLPDRGCSRAKSGRGDPLGFLLYSLQGFVDGLREQSRFIARIQLKLAWEHFVYGEFQRTPSSPAMQNAGPGHELAGGAGLPGERRGWLPGESGVDARLPARAGVGAHPAPSRHDLVRRHRQWRKRLQPFDSRRPERRVTRSYPRETCRTSRSAAGSFSPTFWRERSRPLCAPADSCRIRLISLGG